MTTITGRRPLLVSLLETSRAELWRGVLAGLAAIAPVLAADIAFGERAVLTSAYVLGPFAAAIAGGVAPTIAIALLAVALGAVSPGWNHNLGELDYWARLCELAVGGALAVLIAWLRERARAYTGRLALLNQIGEIADGSLSLADTLERATELIVPDAGDLAMIDAIHAGEVNRAAVRVRGRADWAAIETALRSRAPSVPFWLRDPTFGIPPVPQFLPRVSAGHVEILSHGDVDRAFLASLGLRSALTVPMIARGRLLGTLTVCVAWSKRRYVREDLEFTATLAGRLALALDNAGLFSDLESVERRMDAVMDRIPEAVTVHDASGTLVFANQAAAELIGMESADEVLRAAEPARVSRYELFTEDGDRLPADDLIAEAVRARTLPLQGVYRLRIRESREERWIRVSVEPISGPDGNLLYAVTTIEDATADKRSELAQRLLARVGELLRSTPDYAETVRRVAELATPDFADGCAVSIAGDDATPELVAAFHADPGRTELVGQLADELHSGDDSSPLSRILGGGEPELLRPPDATGFGSAMAVPMAAGPKVVGALIFAGDASSRRFDTVDLDVAIEFGRRAGLAAENARLSERRTEIATTLQRGLMPPEMPPMPGWRVATMYRPAGELTEVGGDFYEAFEVEGGWMIVLGDVVGRGVPAAALTALARHTLHTAGVLTGDPIAALSILNDRLREREPIPLCSAAVIVLEDPPRDAADVFAVAAGHPLPLLVRGSEVVEASAPGPLLGALPDPDWTTSRVEVRPGEQLVVYTDGITDARSGDELFGEERLRSKIAGSGAPEAAVARIERALIAFAGAAATDDAALVAIMREGAPARDARAAERGAEAAA